MKAILPKQEQKSPQYLVLLNGHQYTMGEQQLKSILTLAKKAFRTDHKSGIYAVEKGNVVQMLNEPYSTAEDLRKAIAQYKCKGFYKVHSYLAV